MNNEAPSAMRTRWTIHGERLVDANSHIRLTVASVELPDGKQFEQYVFRMPRCAMTVVLDEPGERLLLIWRHRFVVDRWDWEVPGGYVDPGEDVGSADAPQDVYVARGADRVGEPEIDETEAVRWVPVEEALEMTRTGEIIGAATVIGVQHAVAERMRRNSPHNAV